MRYSEVRRFLEFEGWARRSEEGSHVTFKKKGFRPIIISKVGGKMVPRYQLDEICEIIGLDD
jgi:predicted RNA binding protein YcfA (HicA-like mRNA interferase family)